MDPVAAATEMLREVIQTLKGERDALTPSPTGRSLSVAITHLEDGKLWLEDVIRTSRRAEGPDRAQTD